MYVWYAHPCVARFACHPLRWRLCGALGCEPSCIYGWRNAFLVRGLDSLSYHHGGGRPEKLTPKQKKRLIELIDAGPLVVGFETACWNSVLIRVLIWREFGVLYNRHYVCTLLRNLGFSFQKARFVSDHLDEARRQAWLCDKWPQILRAAQRRKGLLLFEDEASFAQWGSLSYTWSRRGQQPEVPNRNVAVLHVRARRDAQPPLRQSGGVEDLRLRRRIA